MTTKDLRKLSTWAWNADFETFCDGIGVSKNHTTRNVELFRLLQADLGTMISNLNPDELVKLAETVTDYQG